MEAFESRLVIGLTGQKGAGKEAFTNILKDLVAPRTVGVEVFSAPLVQTARIWNQEISRSNLQGIHAAMKTQFGRDVLSNVIYQRALERTEDIIILDGARSQSDLAIVRKFPRNLFVYITADPETRWKRTAGRGQKTGEEITTLEQFMEEEKHSVEEEIPLIGAKADFPVDNNGSPDELRSQVEEFYKSYVLKKLA